MADATSQAFEDLPDNQEKVDLMNKTAWDKSRLDPQLCVKIADEAIALSKKLNYKMGEAEGLKNRAQGYWLTADYVVAMEECVAAIDLFEELGSMKSLSDSYNILGALYASLDERKSALKYYELCLELKRKIKDNDGVVRALNSIGDNYMHEGVYKKAISCFEECLLIPISSQVMKGIVLYNLGEAHYRLDLDEVAMRYLAQSKAIGDELGFPLMVCYNTWIIGEIALKRNEPEKALENLHISLKAATEVNAKDRIYLIHGALSKVHKALGETEKALDHFEQFHELKEAVLGEENAKKIKQLQIRYQTMTMQKETDLIKAKMMELEQANREIELQKSIIESKNQSITDSINYAYRIQRAILPIVEPSGDAFSDRFVYYSPKDILSGDFYWTSSLKNLHFVAVGDCTGHGVPGAMMSVLGANLLDQVIIDKEISSPAKALEALDDRVDMFLNRNSNDVKDGIDLAFCVFDLDNNEIVFAGARRPLYRVRSGELIEIRGTRRAIGDDLRSKRPFENHVLDVKKGDLFYMFSDGYVDQFGGDRGGKFLTRRFKELLLEIAPHSMNQQLKLLELTLEEWRADKAQVDDVCVMGIRI